jgi:hypothetical protein
MTNAVDLKEKTERTDEVILSIEKKLDTLNGTHPSGTGHEYLLYFGLRKE